ncbi:MAG: hypothetical protein ACXAC2_23600 [Candidatus Kariarchaeaceae archaeon]|jgi:hypothetical protein
MIYNILTVIRIVSYILWDFVITKLNGNWGDIEWKKLKGFD